MCKMSFFRRLPQKNAKVTTWMFEKSKLQYDTQSMKWKIPCLRQRMLKQSTYRNPSRFNSELGVWLHGSFWQREPRKLNCNELLAWANDVPVKCPRYGSIGQPGFCSRIVGMSSCCCSSLENCAVVLTLIIDVSASFFLGNLSSSNKGNTITLRFFINENWEMPRVEWI